MKQFFKRLLALCVVATTVMGFGVIPANAQDYAGGGYALSTANQSVYASNSTSSAVVGTVYAFEGITIMYAVGNNLYINYSTPSGAKQGYLINPKVDWRWTDQSSLGYVKSTSNLWYGPNTSTYELAGTVYAGEYVAVLAANNGWAYVEYNTAAGRKRGYMSYSNLTIYNHRVDGTTLYSEYSKQDAFWSESANVRSGPGEGYPVIGSISNEDIKVCYRFPLYGSIVYLYIEYTVDSSGKIKSGYVETYDY